MGQEIKTNLLSSAIAFQMQDYFTIHNMGVKFNRPNSGIGHPGNPAPFGTYKTKDGFLAIAMNPFATLVQALGDDSLLEYNNNQVLFDKRDEIYYRIQQVTVTKTTQEWLDTMLPLDLWVAQVNSQDAVADDPQVIHNNTFVQVKHPKAGNVTVTNVPFTMSQTPGRINRPSPLIGEHGPEILKEMGYSNEDIERLVNEKIISVEKVAEH